MFSPTAFGQLLDISNLRFLKLKNQYKTPQALNLGREITKPKQPRFT
jgi:hypothetical protein